jgi:hypothetical protein
LEPLFPFTEESELLLPSDVVLSLDDTLLVSPDEVSELLFPLLPVILSEDELLSAFDEAPLLLEEVLPEVPACAFFAGSAFSA